MWCEYLSPHRPGLQHSVEMKQVAQQDVEKARIVSDILVILSSQHHLDCPLLDSLERLREIVVDCYIFSYNTYIHYTDYRHVTLHYIILH